MRRGKVTIVVEYDYDETAFRQIPSESHKTWGESFADGCIRVVEIFADFRNDISGRDDEQAIRNISVKGIVEKVTDGSR